MRAQFELLERAAKSEANILILGESGTGKEVAARAVHRWSTRKDASFIAVNCVALAPTLLESELFGHERGAFTGAERRRRVSDLRSEGRVGRPGGFHERSEVPGR